MKPRCSLRRDTVHATSRVVGPVMQTRLDFSRMEPGTFSPRLQTGGTLLLLLGFAATRALRAVRQCCRLCVRAA